MDSQNLEAQQNVTDINKTTTQPEPNYNQLQATQPDKIDSTLESPTTDSQLISNQASSPSTPYIPNTADANQHINGSSVTAQTTPVFISNMPNTAQNHNYQFLCFCALKALGLGFVCTLPILFWLSFQGITHLSNPANQSEQNQIEVLGFVYFVIFGFITSYIYSRMSKLSIIRSIVSCGISLAIGTAVVLLLQSLPNTPGQSYINDLVDRIKIISFMGFVVFGTAFLSLIGLKK